MKIQYRKGDLFQTDIRTIVHGCNAQGVMGSGVAKIVKERYPEAFGIYYRTAQMHTSKELLGKNIVWFGPGRTIVNSVTQEYYGRDGKRYADYDAIRSCMSKIESFFGADGPETVSEIAMPQIGAGLGGGDWRVIETIIESELKTIQPVVYVLDN